MRFRLLFRTYEISEANKQQLLYGVAVLVCVLSVFGFIFLLSYYSEAPSESPLPSPATSAFTQNLQAPAQNPQIAGTQTQQIPQQTQPHQEVLHPVPSPAQSSTPGPEPSPSPSPSPENKPKITNISESDKTAASIKLKFSVDKTSDCKVTYRSDPGNKKEQESSTKRTTSPEISLADLSGGTEYTYSITCKDVDSGLTSTAGDYKFKTN